MSMNTSSGEASRNNILPALTTNSGLNSQAATNSILSVVTHDTHSADASQAEESALCQKLLTVSDIELNWLMTAHKNNNHMSDQGTALASILAPSLYGGEERVKSC